MIGCSLQPTQSGLKIKKVAIGRRGVISETRLFVDVEQEILCTVMGFMEGLCKVDASEN